MFFILKMAAASVFFCGVALAIVAEQSIVWFARGRWCGHWLGLGLGPGLGLGLGLWLGFGLRF